jgi:hypothetical protein
LERLSDKIQQDKKLQEKEEKFMKQKHVIQISPSMARGSISKLSTREQKIIFIQKNFRGYKCRQLLAIKAQHAKKKQATTLWISFRNLEVVGNATGAG